MFEHLGPVPETKTKIHTNKTKMYTSFLVGAILVFTFSFAVSRGPSSVAQEYEKNANIGVQISSESAKHTYVSAGDNFELFSFNINTDRPGIVLYQLKFGFKGLYDIDMLGGLKLFHQSVQLGDIKQVDSQGNVYFDIENYVLPKGDNYFSLVLPKDTSIEDGDILQVSLVDSTSAFLKYQDSMLTAKGDFPIVSGPLSFVEHGLLTVLAEVDKYFKVAELPQPFLSFRLKNKSEEIALTQLTVDYTEEVGSLLGDEFALITGKQALATGIASDNSIIFDFKRPLMIEDDTKIILHSLGSPEGEYDFVLAGWQAVGSVSGQDIPFSEQVNLSQVQVIPYFPELKAGELKNTLSDGWNELYSIETTAKGIDKLELYKLTWFLDAYGLDVSQAEVWVDGKVYIADIVVSDDKLIVKASWDNPIVIDKKSTDIRLLIKVADLSKQAKVETYLMTDDAPLADDDLSGNILWGYNDELYNGYLLPYLPLLPNILNN